MKITSPAFKNHVKIPSQYTCTGKDISPPLEIQDVPVDAKSLVLIIDDPDAPGGTWVHWVVYNMLPTVTRIQENTVPDGGIEGLTSFGKHEYGGPCPPSGQHRYFFKLYALNTLLDLPEEADKKLVETAMESHILEQAELVGIYSREG